MTRFVCLLLPTILALHLQSQTMIERDQYLSNLPNDSLLFFNIINKDTLSISYLSDQTDTTLFRQVFAGVGSWTIRNTTTHEQWLESIQLASGWEYRFSPALKMLPPSFKTWQSFSNEAAFTAYFRGARRGKGVFKLEIKIQNKDSARTPLRNFGDCIVLTTDASTSGTGFPQLAYSLKEWYARDTGLVKLAGTYTSGPNTQTLKIASNLIHAQLQGKPLGGRN